MHTYVRRNILPSHVDVHGGRLRWQFHRQHCHGAPWSESRYSNQWTFCDNRLGPDGNRTFHFLTAPRKAIILFYRSHPLLISL